MSSQHTSKGRRTPLTLGQQSQTAAGHHKSGSGRKGSHSDADNASATTTVNIEQLKQKASIDMAAAAAMVGPKSVKENALQKAAAAQEAAAAAAAAAAAEAKTAAAADDVIVIEDNDESNGSGGAQVKSKRVAKREAKEAKAAAASQPHNGNGKVQAQAVAEEAAAVVSQPSPRTKSQRERTDKEEAEEKQLEAVLAEFEAQDNTVEAVRTPEKAKRKPAATSASSSPVTTTPTKRLSSGASSKTNTTPAKSSSSVVDDVDMETLAMESDATDTEAAPTFAVAPIVATAQPDAPLAAAVAGSPPRSAGKVFKYTQSPAPQATGGSIRSRLSPFAQRRRSIEEAAAPLLAVSGAAAAAASEGLLANLSTVSERSNESRAAGSPMVEAAAGDAQRLFGSLRHITGRRSTRPLRELALQHQMAAHNSTAEVYRRTRTELDDSISSMNATAGSEFEADSADELAEQIVDQASSSASRKRTQLMAGGASEPDLHTASLLESPKRPRLDLSGFLGMMASPVTLLRNKFARSSLLSSSTPNKAKKLDVDAAEEEVAVVVAKATAAADADEEKVDDVASDAMEVVVEAAAAAAVDQTDVEAEIAAESELIVAAADGDEVIVHGAEKMAADAIVVEGEATEVAPVCKRNKYACSIM